MACMTPWLPGHSGLLRWLKDATGLGHRKGYWQLSAQRLSAQLTRQCDGAADRFLLTGKSEMPSSICHGYKSDAAHPPSAGLWVPSYGMCP